MSKIALSSNQSGTGVYTLASPAGNTDRTLTIPDAAGQLVLDSATQTLTNKTLTAPVITNANVSSMASSVITSGTSVASTSGTSIDFTSIPSWVKRITVIFQGVSTSGTSIKQIQIGSGSVLTTGYSGSGIQLTDASSVNAGTSTTGFQIRSALAADTISGNVNLSLLGSNIWSAGGSLTDSSRSAGYLVGGSATLSGALDRVRITTVNGTDTFDAGSINILYE